MAIVDRCVSKWISFYYSTDFTLFRPATARTPSRRVKRLQHYHKWLDKWLMGKPSKDYDE